MKKNFAIVAMVAAFTFGMTPSVMAQDENTEVAEQVVDSAVVDSVVVDSVAEEPEVAPVVAETPQESEGLHKVLKTSLSRVVQAS